ncbi:MAG: hypothetical protein GY841_13790, partial [FCB group bacterium]|nr:hypothetical protein [FCB group bacterium]
LTGKKPDLRRILAFGTPCTVRVEKHLKAWEKRSIPGVILGLNESVKGYRVYVPKRKQIVITWDIKKITSMTEEQNKDFIKILGVDGVNPKEITDKSNFERDERMDEQELNEERNEIRSEAKARNIRPLRAFASERDRVIDQSRTGKRSNVNAVQPEKEMNHGNELNDANPNNYNEAM